MKDKIGYVGEHYEIKRSEIDPDILIMSVPISSLSQSGQLKMANNASFINENIEGLRKVLEIESTATEIKLMLQYIAGYNLMEAEIQKFTIEEKINLCLKISKRLSTLHSQQIIHLNLTPSHILIENQSNEIYFISLGLANRVQRKNIEQNKLLLTTADPDYIAPEQTGRIRSDISYSSDIYSMGVVFYWIFTNTVPFASKQGPAKIHAHIALKPLPPIDIAPIPQMLSRLILKMLEKDIEVRYHSADGVVHDLQIIKEQLNDLDHIPDFVLGKNDTSGILRLTNHLYGRENHIDKLIQVLKAVSNGEKRFLLLYGHAGTGKSSLVDQLYRPINTEGGLLISGKFDSLKTDIPYFAFNQAFGKLIDRIEISSPDKKAIWKAQLKSRLNPIGRVLYDLIPGLEKLLDEQPELPALNGLEAQLRFNYCMSNFLQVASELIKPLVIFLDDLQWSDSSSLSLIKNILTNKELKNILIIGAYRDNEITLGHQFLQFKMDIEESSSVPLHEISVENLELKDIHSFIQDTLGHSERDLTEFSELVHKKSNGNALFVTQFLKSVYNNEMLYFDRKDRSWKWDKEKILRFNLEGDIVNLLLETIHKLLPATVSVLKLASCIGNKFNLNILAKVTDQAIDQIWNHIKPAINIGLVLDAADDTNFYFVHDRVQQAFYSLTDDASKGKFHLEIGRLIAENIPEQMLRDSIFDIVNQFNFAKDLIIDPSERKKISRLNLIAGNRSQAATAYFVASQYYENALYFLPPDAWHSDYTHTYQLYLQAAIAANQSNNTDRFLSLIDKMNQHVIAPLDILKLAELKIQRATATNDLGQVIAIGLKALSDVRIHIKAAPSQIDVLWGYMKTNMRLNKFSDAQILALPKIDNEELIIAMQMMHHVSLSAYYIVPNMVPLIMFELIKLTLEYGLGPKSPFAFIVFGYINIAFMNKTEKGIKMGQLGNKLTHLLRNDDQAAGLTVVYHTFISHYLHHLGKNIPAMEEGFKKGLETGDFEFTSITGQLLIYWYFYSGEALEKVVKRGELLSLQIEPLNQILQIERIRSFRQSIDGMIYGVQDFNILKGEIYNENEVKFPKEPAYDLYFHNLNMQKKFLAILFNQYETALTYSKKENEFMNPVKGSPTEQLYYFYESICITPLYAHRSAQEQKVLLGTCEKNLHRFKTLIKYSEVNYIHRYHLMNAELHQLKGNYEIAKNAYSDAIRCARLNKFMQDEALAWERTGLFYLNLKQTEVAQFYLSNAYKTYKKWGADAKLTHMRDQFKEYLSVEDIGTTSATIDLNTILKTIRLLSGETNLGNLLTGLMNLVTENAGAERAYLIMQVQDKKIINASVDKAYNEIKVLQNIALEDSKELSHMVIHHVAHTGETLVLEDAMEKLPYANDDYIFNEKVRSIVCHPLKQAGICFAYLYIENKLVPGAFTKERIEIIQVIATQTAISLQNAMLFEQTSKLNQDLSQEIVVRKKVEDSLRINEKKLEEYNANLENKIQERTKDLQIEKKKSDDLLLNILPYDIAMELKEKGSAAAKTFESVSVLFTDFKDFTRISESMNAAELVMEIDFCFRKFDEIMLKYKIEKIKTIGDSYMAVGGLPIENETHASDVVNAALEIRDFIAKYNEERKANQLPLFEIRIGINTGFVVAGIVGSNKFAYDIWGDAVNLASRMESNSEPGMVNISSNTFELVKNDFQCTYRGKIFAKSKGDVDMYFVERVNKVGTLPQAN